MGYQSALSARLRHFKRQDPGLTVVFPKHTERLRPRNILRETKKVGDIENLYLRL